MPAGRHLRRRMSARDAILDAAAGHLKRFVRFPFRPTRKAARR
jgi:hypothetical protein